MWQQADRGPTDPQAGNIPGGRRDAIGTADFNDRHASAFAVDSGVWPVASGTLSVAAASQGLDAAAVFYLGRLLPIYLEITADISAKGDQRLEGQCLCPVRLLLPTDFKFAGIDIATNKMVIGHRTATSWQLDVSGSVPGSLKSDTAYPMLVTVNGTTVTVVLNNTSLVYTFAPRIMDGEPVGLEQGAGRDDF